MPPADELLRPALEAALVVARAGERATPSIPAPQALRGVLHFKRFPAAARDFARRAIEEDEEFRERVADEVTEAQVGEAGWLYLTRPDGWSETFEAMAAESGRRRDAAMEERGTQQLERRLLVAEDRLRQHEMKARALEEDADAARAELAEERRARREVQERLDAVVATVDAAQEERDGALAAREEALAAAELARQEAADVRVRAREAEVALASATVPEPSDAGGSPELAKRAEAAAVEADRLAEELHFLADEFIEGARPLTSGRSRGRGPAPAPSAAGPVAKRARARGRRGPVELPPGVMDGSPEAAAHLVRMPGVHLLVDGYNVTKRAWGDATITEQRGRLVRALDDLSLRTGAQPTVVFDGDDVDPTGSRESTRSVQVLFSPADVSADAIVLECIGRCPPDAPVVVVSSDNEVREGARARGARLLHSDVFFGILRR
jgi:multidrug efflux pump subunit AcrA (membrane-fusion protein)